MRRRSKYVVIDFEYAVHKALADVFPLTRLYFCNFHFGQAFFRQIQKNNLVSKYNNNPTYRTYLKMILALAYENPINVLEKFNVLTYKIKNSFKCNDTLKLLEYFDKTYIGSKSRAIFKIEDWSVFYRILDGIPTTTNVSEAWNRGLNYSIRNPHPKLNDLLKELKSRDYLTTVDIMKILVSPVSKKQTEKQLKIKRIIENYEKYYDLTFLYAIIQIKDYEF